MKQHYITISAICWILLLLTSAMWNIWQLRHAHQAQHLKVARSFFGLVVTIREWNAQLGGVYAPITPHLQPNPYLDTTNRELYPPDGPVLTKVNPAYMTRLLAALAAEKQDVRFRISSLQPVNPSNQATAWERQALLAFEQQAQEFYTWDQQAQTFTYMAPLIAEASCLTCHAQYGSQLNEIRGGISVSFSTPPVNLNPILFSHSLIMLVGLVAMHIVGQQLLHAFAELEARSQLDGLTQVFNRGYFDAHLKHEFKRAQRHNRPFSVILGDVDNFKAYNDLYGHQAGDHCLQIVANTLQLVASQTDGFVARYGGEEFVLILPNTAASSAHSIAEQARIAVERLAIRHPGGVADGYVTLSLGVAIWHPDDYAAATMLARADKSLYQAKQSGRNCVVVASEMPALMLDCT
ncbi:diguanylate cyclase [Candidatus Viridilinea mediisalina]|uniref:diguanylate cyclase n=1 Tax=Candidatus Viridilinea mediisalina TaxID=2024553 RepID=UPI0013FD9AFB|nr:diguanylate cyclase [Candidatus Viridilinea mediisalina]